MAHELQTRRRTQQALQEEPGARGAGGWAAAFAGSVPCERRAEERHALVSFVLKKSQQRQKGPSRKRWGVLGGRGLCVKSGGFVWGRWGLAGPAVQGGLGQLRPDSVVRRAVRPRAGERWVWTWPPPPPSRSRPPREVGFVTLSYVQADRGWEHVALWGRAVWVRVDAGATRLCLDPGSVPTWFSSARRG